VTWDQINLADCELRLRSGQTKTGTGRTVQICPTLRAWLRRYKGVDEIYRPYYDEKLREVRTGLGYGRPTKENPDLKPWVPDVLRHTAISHYFRKTGSYGRTAEQFGNSESIIKKHYQSRVSSKETKRFYALRPMPAKPAKAKQKRAKEAKQTPKAAPAAANVVPLPVQAAA